MQGRWVAWAVTLGFLAGCGQTGAPGLTIAGQGNATGAAGKAMDCECTCRCTEAASDQSSGSSQESKKDQSSGSSQESKKDQSSGSKKSESKKDQSSGKGKDSKEGQSSDSKKSASSSSDHGGDSTSTSSASDDEATGDHELEIGETSGPSKVIVEKAQVLVEASGKGSEGPEIGD